MNQTSDLANVVVAVVVAVVPFIFKQFEEWVEKNQTAKTIVSILPTIAKDAVVIAEKLGVEEKLTSEIKNSKAVQSVAETLKKLGFTEVDEQIIKNAVESAYAELEKNGTLSIYKQDTKQEHPQVAQPQVEPAKQEQSQVTQSQTEQAK